MRLWKPWLFSLLALTASPALADVPCPTVSDNVSILNVQVSNAPLTVAFAGLDLETSYLTVTFINRQSQMFLSVPVGAVSNGQIDWNSLQNYHQALMQERSTCPILYPNGLPIWTQ